MHTHSETRILPYTPKQLFDLVADVESYPQFLPWCVASRIVRREENVLFAELVIGYKMLRESYVSRVELCEPKSDSEAYEIDVRLERGPFSELTNLWKFQPVEEGTALSFDLRFAFKSSLLEKMMGAFFDKAVHKMVQAFEERAAMLYRDATAAP